MIPCRLFLLLTLGLWVGACAMPACAAAAASGIAPLASTSAVLSVSDVPWSKQDDADPVFTPDRKTVVFARGNGLTRHLYIAHRDGGLWSKPEPVPFSDQWMDLEPAIAPDGSYLVFISNRPTTPGGKPLDGYWGGKSRPGRGGNLWRVNLTGDVLGTPERLPDIVNASTATYSPAVAADGSVYFTHPDPQTHHTRLYVSRLADGRFQTPQPMPFSDGVAADYDAAVAPDQSFIVFSSNRPPTPANDSDLFVAFATATGWGQPIRLGPSGIEARLDPGLSTLYFTAADNRIYHLPIARWLAQHVEKKP